MTDTAVEQPTTNQDYLTISLQESLTQENAHLRQQLADRERQLVAMHAKLDQLVDERIAELITLQDVDLQIHAQLDLDYVVNAVLEWMMLTTSAVAGTLYLLSDPPSPTQGPKVLHPAAQRGYWSQMAQHNHPPWPAGHAPINHDILARALETGQAVRQAPINQDRARLTVPIQHQGSPIGVLGLESSFVDGFSSTQIDSATCLAQHASFAIQNALQHQQTLDSIDELLAVHQSCLGMTQHLDPDTLPDKIARTALAVLDAERAAVYRYHSPDSFSRAAALTQGDQQRPETDPSERALVETAAQGGTAQFARHPTAGETAALPLTTHPLHTDTAETRPLALDILYLAFGTSDHLATEKRAAIHLFAGYASSALLNARQTRDAFRDYQTEIVNTSRTPLTSIQGYAKLMLQGIGGEITDQQRQFLETILRNAFSLETSIGKQSTP